MNIQDFWSNTLKGAWQEGDPSCSDPHFESEADTLDQAYALAGLAYQETQGQESHFSLFLLQINHSLKSAFWIHVLGFYMTYTQSAKAWFPELKEIQALEERGEQFGHNSLFSAELIYAGGFEQICHIIQLDRRLQSKPSSERLALINEEYGLWQQHLGGEPQSEADLAFLFHALALGFEGYQVSDLYQRSQAAPLLVTFLKNYQSSKSFCGSYYKTLKKSTFFGSSLPPAMSRYSPVIQYVLKPHVSEGSSRFFLLTHTLLFLCEQLTSEEKKLFCGSCLPEPVLLKWGSKSVELSRMGDLFNALDLFTKGPLGLEPSQVFFEMYDMMERYLCEYRDHSPEDEMPESQRKIALIAWYLYRDLDYVLDQADTFLENCQEILLREFEPHENLPGQFRVDAQTYWKWLDGLTPNLFLETINMDGLSDLPELQPPSEQSLFWPNIAPLS